MPVLTESQGVHDFDFFFGSWRVHHRRLGTTWETNWVMDFDRFA
jgi:hypothetical protein